MRKLLILVATLALGVPAAASEPFNNADYQGKVLLLDFWASWCVPCRESFPWMNDMQARYGDAGLVVVAINLDSQTEKAQEFLQEFPAAFAVVFDPQADFARKYEVDAMPNSFLFARSGELILRHRGFRESDREEYEAAILEALHRVSPVAAE